MGRRNAVLVYVLLVERAVEIVAGRGGVFAIAPRKLDAPAVGFAVDDVQARMRVG